MNIVQVYAPTNEADEDDKEEFFNSLEAILTKSSNKDINIFYGRPKCKSWRANKIYLHIDKFLSKN